jgi:hypothetical protein
MAGEDEGGRAEEVADSGDGREAAETMWSGGLGCVQRGEIPIIAGCSRRDHTTAGRKERNESRC